MQVPTIKVRREGGRGFHIINESDFDPKKHKRHVPVDDVAVERAARLAAEAKAKADAEEKAGLDAEDVRRKAEQDAEDAAIAQEAERVAARAEETRKAEEAERLAAAQAGGQQA